MRFRIAASLLAVVFCALLLHSDASASWLFEARQDFESGGAPFSVDVADLNNDGDLDMVSANWNIGTVSVFLGNGDGSFDPCTDYNVGTYPYCVRIADLDDDNAPDIAVANRNSNSVSVLFGNGNGTFSGRSDYTVGTSPQALTIVDLDDDGAPDLAVANYYDNDISVLMGNGNGSFSGRTDYGVPSRPTDIASADLDGDGAQDLAVAAGLKITVFLGNGNGSMGSGTDYSAGTGTGALAIADLNGDTVLDFAVTNLFMETVSILIGNGDGSFGPRTTYPVGEEPVAIAVTDPNGDGDADLVVANRVSNNITLLIGAGDGTFGNRADYCPGDTPHAVAVADLDVDGTDDLVVANKASNNISVFLGNEDGTVLASAEYDSDFWGSSVIAADFNGDQVPDLAETHWYLNTLSVLLGNGDGSFSNLIQYSTGGYPYHLAAEDLDNDGATDIVVANRTTDNVSVYLGRGDGTFDPRVSYATGDEPFSVAIADFDDDGKPDLAVPNGISNDVSVLLGNGNGTFTNDGSYDTGSRPSAIATADLNNDQIPDLAVANMSGDNVSVLLANGDGSFGSRVDYGAGDGPNFISAMDLNGDGEPDLTVTNRNSDDVSVLIGYGNGSFASSAEYAVGESPMSTTVADLDGDGIPDLTVPKDVSTNVSVLLGNGDGSFGDRADYGTGIGPTSAAVADLNGDGGSDIAVANGMEGFISVLLSSTPDVGQDPPPAIPTGLSADPGSSDGRILVTWNANGEPDFDYYRLQRSLTPTFSSYSTFNTSSTSRLDTGLTPGETYYYRVIAVDDGSNQSAPSGTVSENAADFAPAVPTGLAAVTGPDDGKISVSWNANGESDFDYYRLQRSTSPSFSSYSNFITAATSRLDTGLVPGSTYYYRVIAVDDGSNQSSASGTVSAVASDQGPPPVSVPTGVEATPGNGEGEILISWDANSEPDLDHYRVERDDAPVFGAGTVSFDTSSTLFQSSGLVPGQTYYFRVIAVTTTDESEPSATVLAAALDLVPAVPTGLDAVTGPDDGKILVSWDANSESDFDHYKLQRSTSPSFSSYSTYVISSTSRLDTGLVPGETYYYRVRAVDDGSNESNASGTVSAVASDEGSGTVAVPTGVAATAGPGEGQIQVSWDANSEPDLDHYRVERDDAPTFGAGTVAFNTASTSHLSSGLVPGQTYYYRVIAVTTSSESEPSVTVSAAALDLVPAVPTGLAASTGPDEGKILVSWNPSGESDFDHFKLQRSLSSEFTGGSTTTFITSSTSRLDTGLAPGMTYFYRIYAVDDGANESNASGTVSAVASEQGQIPVAAPTGVAASSGSIEGSVLVTWNANSEPDLDHYRVERDDAPTFGAGTVTFDTPSTSYQDSGLTPGQTFYYRVIAVTTSDESEPSSTASAAALDLVPAVPTGLDADTGPDEGKILVSWNANSESDFDYYRLQRSTSPSFSGYSTFIVTSTSRLDTGLTPGTTYYYRIYAVDDGSNQSDASGTVSAVASEEGPVPVAAPTGVAAAPGAPEGGILVTWNANSEPDLDHYRVERDDAPTFGAGTVTFDTPSTSYQDSGLVPGQTFYYRVIAVTTSDESDPSSTASAAALDLAPAVPTGLDADTGPDEGKILVSWNANSESDFDYFRLQRSESPTFSGGYSTFVTSNTSRLDTGLTPGSTYYYRIYAVDDGSNQSNASGTVSAVASEQGSSVVAVPVGVNAVSGSNEGSITVYWTANNEPDLDHYRVERDDAPVFGGSTESFDTADANFMDSGLMPGHTYYYRVIAVTTSSESDPSESVSAFTPDLVPEEPTGLTVNPGSAEGEMLVTWDPNSEPDIDHYFLERCATPNFGGNTEEFDTPAAYFLDSGLTSGDTYHYRVTVVDAAGNWSSTTSSVSGDAQDLGAVAAPTGLTAGPDSDEGEILVSWNANDEPVDHYRVERDDAPLFGAGKVSFVTSSTSYQDSGLVPGQTYYYRVVAVIASDESDPSVAVAADARDFAPETPTGLVASAGPGEGAIQITWNAVGAADLDYYRLERSPTPVFGSGRVQVDTTVTSHRDSGLMPGQTYYYRVIAVDNGANQSDPSATASAVTLDFAPAAPTNLAVAGGPGQGEATVMWDASAEPDIDRYVIERDILEFFNMPDSFMTSGTSLIDDGLEEGETYYYRVFAVDVGGNQSEASETFEITLGGTSVPETEDYSGASMSLIGPNPSYSGQVAFAYTVPQDGANVSISLYSVSGRLVSTVVDGHHGGGVHEATWDGKSRGGQQVSSGVYLCLTRIGEWTDRSKVTIAR